MVNVLFTANTIWTVPPDWTNQNVFEAYGGGGGATGQWFDGGSPTAAISGFAGGYNYTYNINTLKPGDQLNIEIGRRGVGGVGTGTLNTVILSGGGRYKYFTNYNFVGTAGTDSIVTLGGSRIIQAWGGGPGVVNWSNQISVYPYTVYYNYPGPNQPGYPLCLWNINTNVYSQRYTPYPPVNDGALVRLGLTNGVVTAGAGGVDFNTTSSTYVQQSGQNGLVGISYISSVTHSPCVWIS
jgi:hypothetical protein